MHTAFVGRLQTRQDPQQAGFSDAAGAEDRHHFAGLQLQVETFQHGLPALLAGVAEADLTGIQQRHTHAAVSRA